MSKESEGQPHGFTLEEVTRIARETLLKDGGHAPPVLVEGSMNTDVGQIAEFPETHEGKIQRMRSCGFALGQTGKVGEMRRIFFICEGWMSTAQKGAPRPVRPAQDPNRTEVLLIAHLWPEDNRTDWVGFEMVRSARGKLVALRELQDFAVEKGRRMESPLLGAFVAGFGMGMRMGFN